MGERGNGAAQNKLMSTNFPSSAVLMELAAYRKNQGLRTIDSTRVQPRVRQPGQRCYRWIQPLGRDEGQPQGARLGYPPGCIGRRPRSWASVSTREGEGCAAGRRGRRDVTPRRDLVLWRTCRWSQWRKSCRVHRSSWRVSSGLGVLFFSWCEVGSTGSLLFSGVCRFVLTSPPRPNGRRVLYHTRTLRYWGFCGELPHESHRHFDNGVEHSGLAAAGASIPQLTSGVLPRGRCRRGTTDYDFYASLSCTGSQSHWWIPMGKRRGSRGHCCGVSRS